MGAHRVSMLAPASICTAQHYQLLFRQGQLMNSRAEMHLNGFIWLVLGVFLPLLQGGWISVCVCWLTDVLAVKPWKFLPNKWIKVRPIFLLTQILYAVWAGSIVFWNGKISQDRQTQHSFWVPQLYILFDVWIKMNPHKKHWVILMRQSCCGKEEIWNPDNWLLIPVLLITFTVRLSNLMFVQFMILTVADLPHCSV